MANNFYHSDDPRDPYQDQNEGGSGGGTGDMEKSVYDTNGNNIVDNSEKVDGVDTAGNYQYYGTDETGTPGFHALPTLPTVVTEFTGLDDTPSDYTGSAGKVVKVNVTEDGLEFADESGGSTGKPLTVKTVDGTGELPNWAAWVADASAGPLTRALPTTPEDGEEVTVHDINGFAETNNITVTVTGPTTVSQPTLNIDKQSKKWRYDLAGDVWDLVFNNAPAIAGGGSAVYPNAEFNTLEGSGGGGNLSPSEYATKGHILTCTNSVTLTQVTTVVDAAYFIAPLFTVAEIDTTDGTISSILYQELCFGYQGADTVATGAVKSLTAVIEGGLGLVSGKTYSFMFTDTYDTATRPLRVPFPSEGGDSGVDFTYYGCARYATLLPAVTDVAVHNTTASVYMTLLYSK